VTGVEIVTVNVAALMLILPGAPCSLHQNTETAVVVRIFASSNVMTITDPTNQITRFEYEPMFNRVTKLTDSLHHMTTIAYNPVGQPTSVQGPIASDPPTTLAYDSSSNLLTTTDPLGNATQRAYDAVSRLTSLTDPRNLLTLFRYDNLNRVTEIADARQGITRFDYDRNGNLLNVIDAKLQPTTYTYDSMDRLGIRKDALNRSESYQYDLAGNLTQVTDRKSQPATFQYDALNRRTRADYADGSFTTLTYDAVGRLTWATDSTSSPIEFLYDTLDRLVLEVTTQGAVAYAYDVIGRRTTMTVAGQAPVAYQYDAASRLTQVAQDSLMVGLGYDPAGRRTSLPYPNGTSTSYTYDHASRLTNITHTGPSGVIDALTSTYDAAGNRTSLTRENGAASLVPNAVASATYDAANEQTSFAGATLIYDQNGNLKNDSTNTYTWDARNRLTSISGGVAASFNYDPLGRRISKTINGVTTAFVYDGNDIVQEMLSGAVTTNYLRSLNIDELFGILRQDGVYFSIYDGLGSTLALTNQAASSVAQYSYEPFGKTQSSNPSFTNPFQFTGRENDNTGLYYYRARYYSPVFQRFLSQDPLLGLITPVTYEYVFNNPLKFSDSTGLLADALVDLAFIAYDIYRLAADGRKGFGENLPALGLDLVGAITPGVTGLGAASRAARKGLRNTPDQDALIQLANEAKRRGGTTAEEAAALERWAKEYDVPFRGPEQHPTRDFGSQPHIHVGPVNHIPMR